MILRHEKSNDSADRCGGFTITELIVGMVVATIALHGIYNIFKHAMALQRETRRQRERPAVQQQVDELMERMNSEDGINIREVDPPKGWREVNAKQKAESIAPDHEFTARVSEAVKSATGNDAVIGGCPAITIAMVFIERGIPAIICGPGSIAQAHTEDEYVEVSQLPEAARIYTTLMAGM